MKTEAIIVICTFELCSFPLNSLMLRIIFLLIALSITALPQTAKSADSLLTLIRNAEDASERDRLEESLIELMYTAPYDDAVRLSSRLLKVSAGMPERSLEIKVLIHSYRFHGFDGKISMLNKAISLIHETGHERLLAGAYVFKAIAFRDNSMADSAMIYALKARDLLEETGKKEDLMTPMQLIADMHYYAGEYTQAKELYLKIKKLYPQINSNFNYRIIENNLGLVELGLGNYRAAEQHFLNSVGHLDKVNAIYADSAGLPYIFRKLVETNLLKGDVKRAEQFCDSGITLANRFSTFIELPGLYSGKGVILFRQGKPNESLKFLQKAEELEARYPDIKYKIDLYKAFADTWTGLGNFKEANRYLNLYTVERVKSDSLLNRSRIMYQLAAHDHLLAMNQVKGLERERVLYLVILVIMVFSIVILYYYFSRLKRANKILVEKNLQIAYSLSENESGYNERLPANTALEEKPMKVEPDDKKPKDIDDEKLMKIASDLDQLISEKKIYLDPGLTVVLLAEMLNTNRTYLVKAIKKKHGMNFLDFINGHRVAAAIRLLDTERAKNLSLEGIAGLVGFNNRVTFGKVFKQSTGMSPSIFIKSVSEMRRHSVNRDISNSDEN